MRISLFHFFFLILFQHRTFQACIDNLDINTCSCNSSPENQHTSSGGWTRGGSFNISYNTVRGLHHHRHHHHCCHHHTQNTGEVIMDAGEKQEHGDAFTNSSNRKALKTHRLKSSFLFLLCIHGRLRNLIFTTTADWCDDLWTHSLQTFKKECRSVIFLDGSEKHTDQVQLSELQTDFRSAPPV